jgi:uncharacterized membrane protein
MKMGIPMREHNVVTKRAAPALECEQNVYADVYRLLIAGMIASSIMFGIGIVLALIHPQYFPLSTKWVRSQYGWGIVVHGLASGDARSYMMIATVILILTPVARVIVSIYAFFADGDHKYVVVTSIVLLVMIVTVILGLLGLQ